MRTLQLGLMVAALCLTAREARAQPSGEGYGILAGSVEVAIVGASLTTGALSTWHVAHGTRSWVFLAGALVGAGNVAMGIGLLGVAWVVSRHDSGGAGRGWARATCCWGCGTW